jgi:uncharacterized protein (DUF885 family)
MIDDINQRGTKTTNFKTLWRKMAEDAMGDNFDIREFHQRILENGTIPLIQLRAHIMAWIEDYKAHN